MRKFILFVFVLSLLLLSACTGEDNANTAEAVGMNSSETATAEAIGDEAKDAGSAYCKFAEWSNANGGSMTECGDE